MSARITAEYDVYMILQEKCFVQHGLIGSVPISRRDTGLLEMTVIHVILKKGA